MLLSLIGICLNHLHKQRVANKESSHDRDMEGWCDFSYNSLLTLKKHRSILTLDPSSLKNDQIHWHTKLPQMLVPQN